MLGALEQVVDGHRREAVRQLAAKIEVVPKMVPAD